MLCLPASSRCLPLLLLTSMSFTHYTQSKWSREGSFKPWQVLQIPFSSQAAPRTANRAHSRPALAVWPCGYWLTVSPPVPLPAVPTHSQPRPKREEGGGWEICRFYWIISYFSLLIPMKMSDVEMGLVGQEVFCRWCCSLDEKSIHLTDQTDDHNPRAGGKCVA